MSAPATGHVHTPAVPDDRLYFKPIPNLYIYDHCPFCVKARMIFGIRNIKVNLVFFANDDFEGPINLIGKKAVPILEYSHCGTKVIMPESGDIVKHVDTSPDFQGGPQTVGEGTKKQEISRAFWSTPDVKDLFFLTTPERTSLGEFQSVQSRQTFIIRHKLSTGGSYNEAWKRYSELVAKANEALETLENLVESEHFVSGNSWTWDDIEMFALLRGLTGVQGVEWPQKLKAYMISVAKRTDIPLYFNAPVGPHYRDPALFAY
eukprot:Protomagalhaensia_sp_Gyna_25__301@NODE_113_length_5155_cov_105_540070_g89_i0_p3_GENE_NODE_113_length_5155_cov_105_540070_g89_i0NODE_113_length_5155_cov_105_540070_g89_i0_p3_ORF_typecomplete_len262_score37_66Glutaredoxin2_C/PF04399_13/1_3e29GST_N_3/PF13417_6/4_2e05GST_C_3/PF14497_6/0_0021GST_C/PF00043_25/0_01GST_C_2/PF13410_6/0_088Glutaredoxin/PF00462_24/0_25_NODE_113_length_5155_cov_105_540070_g89_i018792664